MPLAAGDKLGPYEVLALIGKGGMGEVYRAHDPRTGRDVAIKVSAADFQNGSLHEFDVTPDGQRFLLILNSRTEGNAERLTVVSNWQAALRK
jgi:serine/threonine protein kinase